MSMTEHSFMENVQSLGLKKVIGYLDADPENNIPKIVNWLVKSNNRYVAPQAKAVQDMIGNKDGNWYKLVTSLWSDLDDGVRKKTFENLIVNASFLGGKKQDRNREAYGCNIPWAILMDPTSACNLKCTGCWAADYGNKMNMSFETLDNIIQQGKELGVYFYIYSGGEPLVRKADIMKLCEKHQDCQFLSFTNGTLIDEAFADEMLRVKNFIPAISVEGFEDATDSRRGEGTYQSVIRAMKILKDKKLPFGISCCYTSQNTDVIGSEAYFDDMIEKGAKFAWFFTYMPVGVNAVPELMVSAQQRAFMYDRIRSFRKTKPIFTLDFRNDGEFVQGCIAGGRRYLHINANGDIEPCAFIHYSDSNVYDNTLLEAMQAPLFMQYHQNQPFNENHLQPCPLLDNPGRLPNMVDSACAASTDLENPEDVHHLSAKCEHAAKEWAPVADNIWTRSQKEKQHRKESIA